MDLSELIQSVKCRFWMHPRLDVIQSFGSALHIGCPYCKREYAMHQGMEVVVPWDDTFAVLYDLMGYDTETASVRWRRYRP